MISKRTIAYVIPCISLFYLWALPNFPTFLALLPYLTLTTKGVDLTVTAGLFLSAIWITYTLTLTFPLYYVLGRYFLLLVYLPINGVVFYKEPHDPATTLFLSLETVFWDYPLLLWINIMNKMGQRALQPFYSPITEEVSLGSLPLSTDVSYLVTAKVGLVVNMCREYAGPVEEYTRHNVRQIYLPTPDICEPRYEDIIQGIYEARRYLLERKEEGEKKKVFVHCKAGRGRSAAFTLCLLVSLGSAPTRAMDLMCERRAVVERPVLRFRVVQKFVKEMAEAQGDFDALYTRYVNAK